MTSEFEAFRSVNFDWTRQLRGIWRDPPYHVASIHQGLLDDLVDYFVKKTSDPESIDEPLGRVVVGPAGYGKTHLIGELRRRIWQIEGWFVLLDFVGIKRFWSSVALGFLNSLQVRTPDGKTQYDWLIMRIASLLGVREGLVHIANRWRERPRELAIELAALFVRSLSCIHFDKTNAHRNVVTALILLNSKDPDCHSIAHAWLQGMEVDPEIARPLGFIGENDPIDVVRGLSWIMSLVGPTLIAVDQIDAIVSASVSLVRNKKLGTGAETLEAQSIVESLALGLMDLHEMKCRTVTVISCLEATWNVLKHQTSIPVTDRYYNPANLRALSSNEIAEQLVEARLTQAYAACSFSPPYPTWPFAVSAFESTIGFSPRQLLKACEDHRMTCVSEGRVFECKSFDATEQRDEPTRPITDDIGNAFEGEKKVAAITGLMDAAGENELHELLYVALCLFVRHLTLPSDIDALVQRDPDQRRPSLHARLSFTFHNESDREQHYCFRILGHTDANAFRTRLNAAMTASGIDTALNFRRLFILRRGEPPGGPRTMTRALVEQFTKAGGRFIAPTDDDLRAFVALQAMAQRDPPGFDAWLRARKPLFDTALFQATGLCPPPFLSGLGPPVENPPPYPSGSGRSGGGAPPVPSGSGLPGGGALATEARETASRKTASQDSASRETADVAAPVKHPTGAPRLIPVGRRFERGTLGDQVLLNADLLPRHTAILAGAGSGKTVLLRRLVEEAALLAIPSVVLDINNDLSRLGDPWPGRPDAFSDADAAAAEKYHEHADVVIWTPGVSSGNPVSLKLIPDFAAIGTQPDNQTEDERAQAVEMARATLSPYLTGTGQKASLKQGVLADALRAFAMRGGGSLNDLIGVLSELPEDASKIGDAPKLASDIANQLLAAIATNPLLQSAGSSLDPQRLFHGKDGRTRISVINLAGLGSDNARQSFVNQLQMTLFTWIKQHPSPTGRLYVLDEAQNFAPSLVGTACKASALSLVAQARKYGLGMIFATQLPKGIDNAAVSNCTTHIYGRMSSPATIQATRDLMAAKGGAADDIGKLVKGEFYFSTEGFNRPVKIRTSLCLSWHPPNPPTPEEVIAKAHATMH